MRRTLVRIDGLVSFFFDEDAAAGGSCWTQTEGQDYWYIVRQNYSIISPDISGGLLAHVGGLSDAVVGLATTVLPLLAWNVSATCTNFIGIRFSYQRD